MGYDEQLSTNDAYRKFAPEYADFSRHYDNFPGLRPTIEAFLDRPRPDGPILDAGCGTGRDARFMSSRGCDVIALDLCDKMLEQWPLEEGTLRCARIQADLLSLPMRNRSVAGVWACASLIHIPSRYARTAIQEFSRVTRPGGLIAITFRNAGDVGWSSNSVVRAPRWLEVITPGTITSMLTVAGFSYVDCQVSGPDGWYVAWGTAPEDSLQA